MKLFLIICLIAIFPYSCIAGKWELLDKGAMGHGEVRYMFIECPTPCNCMVMTDRKDRMTTDCGKTWITTMHDTAIYRADTVYWGTYKYNATSMSYPDTNFCIITFAYGFYLITRNQGKTWEINQIDSLNLPFISDVSFCNNKFGGLVTEKKIFLTRDGGRHWESIDNIDQRVSYNLIFNKIFVLYSNTIFLTSLDWDIVRDINGKPFYEDTDSKGYFYRSYDWGKTWKKLRAIRWRMNDIIFFNKKEGFVAGGPKVNTHIYKDLIYYTSNGGESWDHIIDTINPYPSNPAGLKRIDFADRMNGVALGAWYKMYRTTNGGLSWLQDTSFNYKIDWQLSNISYPDTNDLYGIVSFQQAIYKYNKNISDVSERANDITVISLYPNPITSSSSLNIKIKFGTMSSLDFQIINSTGIIIDKKRYNYLNAGSHTIRYSPDANLPSGTYWIRMTINNKETIVKPVVIVK